MKETINDALSKLYDKLTDWVEGFTLLLPNLLIAVIVLLVIYTAGRLLRKIIDRPLHRLVHSRALVDLALNLISIAAIAFGLFVALSIIGLDKAVTSLLAGVGIVGLALGFAFQDIASNFVSGVLMAISKPIQIGDVIESNDHFGTVVNINLRSTILRTMQGQYVHIPNKDIYNKPIINFSEEGKRRIDLKCGISYGDDLEKVRRVTIEAVQSIEYILPKEGVNLFFKEFGDSSITFEVRYWVDFKKQPDYLAALSEGIIRIKKAYDENNIMIPFPIRTLDFGIKGGEKLNEQLQMVVLSNTNGKHE